MLISCEGMAELICMCKSMFSHDMVMYSVTYFLVFANQFYKRISFKFTRSKMRVIDKKHGHAMTILTGTFTKLYGKPN